MSVMRRWWLTIDTFTHTIKASDEPSPLSPARGYEVVEVVPAERLRGAVGEVRAMLKVRESELNDLGPYGDGYLAALGDVHEDLDRRFGGHFDRYQA